MTTGGEDPVSSIPPAAAPVAMPSVHRLIGKTSSSNLARHGFYLATTLALTPFIVKSLGVTSYGVWVVVLSFLGYAGILEMGVQSALIRLVARHRAKEDHEGLRRTISTALALFIGIGAVCAVLLAVVVPAFIPFVIRDLHSQATARQLCLILSIDLVAVFANLILAGAFYGFHRYALRNLIDIAIYALNAVLIFVFVGQGGVIALAWIKTALDVLSLLTMLALWPGVLPGVPLRTGYITRASLRDLWTLGGKIFFSATMARISTNAQPIIISTLMSPAWTAFYSIPRRLVDSAREIGWALSGGFMPIFSDLDGRSDYGGLRRLYLQYTRYIVLVSMPLHVGLIFYGPAFIGLWIGPEYAEKGRWAVYFLGGALLFEGMQPLAWRLFIGIGRVKMLVMTSGISSFFEVVLGALAATIWGINGLAGVIVAVAAVRHVILLLYVSSYLEMSWAGLFYRTHLIPMAATVPFLVVSVLAAVWLGTSTYPAIALGAGLSTLSYLLVASCLALGREERTGVRNMLRSLKAGPVRTG
jgi:O-antigen/teichoic acid export membrane protein